LNGLAEQIEHGLGFFNDGEDELAATGREQAGLVGAWFAAARYWRWLV
jgi:hypothetical protein